jgi:phosphoribosylformylglycinamidine synthase
MNTYVIVLTPHFEGGDRVGTAHTLGIQGVEAIHTQTLYFIRGELDGAHLTRLCDRILCDPAANTVEWSIYPGEAEGRIVEVTFLTGVMDVLAMQVERAAHEIGLPPFQAATGTRFRVEGSLDDTALRTLTERAFCNLTVQRYTIGRIVPEFVAVQGERRGTVVAIPLDGLDDAALTALSKQRLLSLNVAEMRAIQSHYATLGRAPTDVELEILAQTWSEHCIHKTFKARITTPTGEINGLLKTYIRAATDKINAPWVKSAFVDNAGIITFDDHFDLAYKAETHNHPSALEPFGGANTGVGGVIRDVMAVSARPIAVTDVLCFGPQDTPFEALPTNTLHPRSIQAGVVAGVQDYGNKLGVPTVSGAIYYDPGYTANPLVFCGCVGILPAGSHPTRAKPGDRVVVLGGRTGRDGLHGATFSSDELAHDTGQTAGTVVQIGNPITQKDVMEVVLIARDEKLYTAITDCGAGGLSSAVGEMAQVPGGVDVELRDVPLKYPGLLPWEIWLSEAQERMVMAVAPDNLDRLQAICKQWDVEATVIGVYTDSGKLVVRYENKPVAEVDLHFLHDGIPQLQLKAEPSAPTPNSASPTPDGDLSEHLLKMLADPNIASKEAVIRRYDHEVRAGTVVRPLVGVKNDAPGDGTVLKPLETPQHNMGFALGMGFCPEIGKTDAYQMAISAIDEAIRNIVAVGADPDRIALLDNFCWGDPKDPARLYTLIEACRGCYDAAVSYGTPFISGKDSLNNTYVDVDGARHSIPDTLLISAIGIVPDVTKTITMDLKKPGNHLYLLGNPVNLEDRRLGYRALHQLILSGKIVSCHDISDGGIEVAIAEMCIGGRLGAALDLKHVIETAPFPGYYETGFIVESEAPLNDNGQTLKYIGEVTAVPRLQITRYAAQIDLTIDQLVQAFKGSRL